MSKSLFKELLQRKVFRGIGIYVLAAWLIMQAAEIVLPAFELPTWTLRFVIIALVLGLPVVAVLSWIFDVTPSGIKRDSEIERAERNPSRTGRLIDFTIIGVLAIAATYFGWHYFSGSPVIPEAAAMDPSIAVLPFVNMSGDQDNEYFSDGVSEELLNALAKVEGLKVAGRTSSFFFKGKDQDLRIIGQQLGVATVLEGSVRKAEDRVRVTAQLVKTSDGFHLWSDTFDYQLDDVFQVQDEIARAVVRALKGKLLGEDVLATTSTKTTSSQCFASYLQGRNQLHRRRKESIIRSEALFKEAIEADPNYAPAWVGLAESYMLQHINHDLLTFEDAERKAEEAIQRALALDDNSSEAYAALGLIRMQTERQEEAEAAFSRSLALNPNYPEALHWYALLDKNRGNIDRAYEKLSRSLELDPLHPVARANLGAILIARGDYGQAKSFFERSVSLDPDYAPNYVTLAGIESFGPMCHPARGLATLDQAIAISPESVEFRQYKVAVLLEMDEVEAARKEAASLLAASPGHPLSTLAQFALDIYTGDEEGAIRFLEQQNADNAEKLGRFVDLYAGIASSMGEDYQAALQSFERFDPYLAPDQLKISVKNVGFARLAALVHLKMGNQQQLEQILAAMDQALEKMPRFGPEGYRLADVEIAAMAGQADEAMARFREAYDAGFRNRTLDGIWRLKDNPFFEGLHDRPDFKQLVEDIERYHRDLATTET